MVAVELKSTFILRNESIALRNIGLFVCVCARAQTVCRPHSNATAFVTKKLWQIYSRKACSYTCSLEESVVTLNHHRKVVKTCFLGKDKFDYTVLIVKSKTCISFALDFWQSVRDSSKINFKCAKLFIGTWYSNSILTLSYPPEGFNLCPFFFCFFGGLLKIDRLHRDMESTKLKHM